jgi:stage II sporulation protein D
MPVVEVILPRAIIPFCLLAAVFAPSASASFYGMDGFTPPALRGTPQIVINGHGWGHGVGMSQYGAYGYARHGYKHDAILAHYYPGTELAQTAVKSIRVLLASTKSVTISSTGPWKLKDGTSPATQLDPGQVTVTPQLTFKLPDQKPTTRARAFTGPLTFTSTTPLVFKTAYRGMLTVSSDGNKLTLVNTVPLDQYLDGVVPSEMPWSWAPEALESQAVAARSYAIAKRQTTGPFDVYPDTRDQVYGGVAAEHPETTAAVKATSGQVLTYGGKVATTYFFSTSGGRTAAIDDVWKAQPVPYLVSVPDPYDSISPYHNWGPFDMAPDRMGKALKVPGRLLDVQTTVNGSGRIGDATAVGDKGDVDMTGVQLQQALGLRSTFFTVGVLALDPLPTQALVYGSPLTLTGLGRSMANLRLEQRTEATDDWASAGAVRPAPDGSFSVPLKASGPAEYRVTSGTLATPETQLVVSPAVTLKIVPDTSSVAGTVKPKLPGTGVQIQQLTPSGTWNTVATTSVSASGSFSTAFAITPGSYRARVAAGNGWAVAFSPSAAFG